jgi:hypothetical protein
MGRWSQLPALWDSSAYLFCWIELRFLSEKQLFLFGQGNDEISAGRELTPGPTDCTQF